MRVLAFRNNGKNPTLTLTIVYIWRYLLSTFTRQEIETGRSCISIHFHLWNKDFLEISPFLCFQMRYRKMQNSCLFILRASKTRACSNRSSANEEESFLNGCIVMVIDKIQGHTICHMEPNPLPSSVCRPATGKSHNYLPLPQLVGFTVLSVRDNRQS